MTTLTSDLQEILDVHDCNRIGSTNTAIAKLEALIQSRERAAQIAILRKVESIGDPVLQEKHLDKLVATLSNNEGDKDGDSK